MNLIDDIKTTEKYDQPCHCGHNHISSIQACLNGRLNNRPVSYFEQDDIIDVLSTLTIEDDVRAKIEKYTQTAIAVHTAKSNIILMHECNELSYDDMMALIRVLAR